MSSWGTSSYGSTIKEKEGLVGVRDEVGSDGLSGLTRAGLLVPGDTGGKFWG